MRFIQLSAMTLMLSFGAPVFAQQAQPGPLPIGFGGFPVTFTHVAAWLAHRAETQGKELTLLVYFEGQPGWHLQATQTKTELKGNPVTLQFSVGKIPLLVTYWQKTATVELAGKSFNLRKDNVFLVEGVDTSNPSSRGLGWHDLTFNSDDNPSIVLLQRSSLLRSALLKIPHKEPAPAAPPEVLAWDKEGIGLLDRKPSEACELFRRAAEKGYAPSQYRLGYCYQSGEGVTQDFAVANQWYEKAASQGHVDAQYKLGHSYRVGRGTEINLQAALHWYKKAAENGDSDAQVNLGTMYDAGQGVEANPQEAFRWYLKAASNGDPSCQFEVARRLRDGAGVTTDLVSAYVWLLVLQAQKRDFDPSSWQTVQEVIDSVEVKLDDEAKARARSQWQGLLRGIARAYIEKLDRSP